MHFRPLAKLFSRAACREMCRDWLRCGQIPLPMRCRSQRRRSWSLSVAAAGIGILAWSARIWAHIRTILHWNFIAAAFHCTSPEQRIFCRRPLLQPCCRLWKRHWAVLNSGMCFAISSQFYRRWMQIFVTAWKTMPCFGAFAEIAGRQSGSIIRTVWAKYGRKIPAIVSGN